MLSQTSPHGCIVTKTECSSTSSPISFRGGRGQGDSNPSVGIHPHSNHINDPVMGSVSIERTPAPVPTGSCTIPANRLLRLTNGNNTIPIVRNTATNELNDETG